MVGGRGLEGEEAEAIDLQAEVDRALTLIRAETLVQIDEALARLDTGRYGQCCLCGSQIPCSRLHVLPMASRCRDCDERQKAERMGSRFPQHHGRVIHIM
jgi:RNA polymerase-binding transcription factor DksA